MSDQAEIVPLHAVPDTEPGDLPAPLRLLPLPTHDRVGVLLVAHSRAVAEAVAVMAVGLLGGEDPAPVGAVGGPREGVPGVRATAVVAGARRVDQGVGVAVLCDLGSSVRIVRELLDRAEELGLPFPLRVCDAPLVEGAVAAVATATAGGDLAAVVEAAEDAYRVRKL
ncbi:PTS fructose transporter subunit IIA [Streptacidiphilus monticola]|uniref:PTS fructose transporter subunit IIA n=1 Tax=Streptacidiphilus monticola TaxID=2161674 RepID=A0ABW1FVD8_9ACTN